jgi:hypothetical protein
MLARISHAPATRGRGGRRRRHQRAGICTTLRAGEALQAMTGRKFRRGTKGVRPRVPPCWDECSAAWRPAVALRQNPEARRGTGKHAIEPPRCPGRLGIDFLRRQANAGPVRRRRRAAPGCLRAWLSLERRETRQCRRYQRMGCSDVRFRQRPPRLCGLTRGFEPMGPTRRPDSVWPELEAVVGAGACAAACIVQTDRRAAGVAATRAPSGSPLTLLRPRRRGSNSRLRRQEADVVARIAPAPPAAQTSP